MIKKNLLVAGLAGVLLLSGCTSTAVGENSSVFTSEEISTQTPEGSSNDSEELNSDTEASTQEATFADTESSTEASSAGTEAATEATTEGTSDAKTTASADKDFYFEELKDNEKKEVDLGSDGKSDSLLLKQPDASGKDKACYLQVNDQKVNIDLVVENGVVYGSAHAAFVHRTDGDYVMLEQYGAAPFGTVTLYKWNNGSLKELGSVDGTVQIYSEYDEKTGKSTYTIDADKVVIGESFEVLGNWIGTKEYKYDDEGFTTYDKWLKLHPLVKNSDGALTLKKTLTFSDESGDPPKTVEAGKKVIPCEAKGNNTIGFMSESGEYLGEITYTLKEENYGTKAYIDGVSEDEVFDNIQNIG